MSSIQNKKVLSVGLVTMDIVQVSDKYPQEDTETRCRDLWYQRGGNASNICTVLSQLGVSCEFFGSMSKETHLNFLTDDFHKRNIDISHCIFHSGIESPISLIILSKSTGSRTIFHHNPGLPESTIDDFKKVDLNDYNWVHFEGRNCSEVRLMMQHILKFNKSLEKGQTPIKISLELEKQRDQLLDLVSFPDVIIIGKDFSFHRGYHSMKETLENMAQVTKLSAIVIATWGDKGAMGRTPDGTYFDCPSFPPSEINDTLGAGDTFCASIIYSMMNKMHLKDCLHFACKVSGVKIGQRGYDHIGHDVFKNAFKINS